VTDEVRAAGGVVLRRDHGRALTVLVHRPRYDDWTFPKGKLLGGESFEEAATREVLEETGLSPIVGAELPPSRYEDQHGDPKVVRYWSMEVLDGHDLRPTQEVDEARWLPFGEARGLLSYDRDRVVLDAIAAWSAPTYLIRHAKAGDRGDWIGHDRERPLSKAGRRQAKALARMLADRPVERILSSPAVRCTETVQPLAEQRGLPVETREDLFEGASLPGMLELLDDLRSTPAVLSGHGDLIPATIEELEARGADLGTTEGWKKGSTWVLERDAGLIVRATYVPPPDADDAPAPRRGGSLG
jgi:phosphohistidine phosphatase SixA/ADP-ribose pyrophosphatase YjhB (NUDIX family)